MALGNHRRRRAPTSSRDLWTQAELRAWRLAAEARSEATWAVKIQAGGHEVEVCAEWLFITLLCSRPAQLRSGGP